MLPPELSGNKGGTGMGVLYVQAPVNAFLPLGDSTREIHWVKYWFHAPPTLPGDGRITIRKIH